MKNAMWLADFDFQTSGWIFSVSLYPNESTESVTSRFPRNYDTEQKEQRHNTEKKKTKIYQMIMHKLFSELMCIRHTYACVESMMCYSVVKFFDVRCNCPCLCGCGSLV